MNHRPILALLAALSAMVFACSEHVATKRAGLARSGPAWSTDRTSPQDLPSLPNTVAYHENFLAGAAPEGDQGFDTLRSLGVKTIISVDGATPEVALAQQRGIRYIHLPIGYNGFDEARKLQLVRAVRDAVKDGPAYLHCHHGKHRAAGAAAAVAVSLGWLTPDEAVARMKVSGTAPNYKGLYACAAEATPVSLGEIDAVPADFPSVWTPSSLVKGMVEIDETLDTLKLVEKAGWAAPADHPDLVPAAEAGKLADLFRVLAEGEGAKRRPQEFARWMRGAGESAQKLEDALNAAEPDAPMAAVQLKLVAASCKECHAKYRD